MTRKLVACLALVLAGGCGGSSGDGDGSDVPTATTNLGERLTRELGEFHLSRIASIPDLRAVFYHDPDGRAVEDSSLDGGATWCRRAVFRWEITDVVSQDDFVVRYTPTAENPSCLPLGAPLVLHVTGRTGRDGRPVLTGDYDAPLGPGVERTVCAESINDWPDVCGVTIQLPVPTKEPSFSRPQRTAPSPSVPARS